MPSNAVGPGRPFKGAYCRAVGRSYQQKVSLKQAFGYVDVLDAILEESVATERAEECTIPARAGRKQIVPVCRPEYDITRNIVRFTV
jgi:hypothetical protein